jgi:glycosyltransferase 2 family protein
MTTTSGATLRRLLPPLAALLLLAALAWRIDLRAVVGRLAGCDPWWVLASLLLLAASNALSAGRWARIVRGLGLQVAGSAAVRLYFQGVALNTVLPGATVGGDLWRALGLHRTGQPLASCTSSVLLDRIGGVCTLGAVAALAGAGAWAAGLLPTVPSAALWPYLAALAAVGLLPLIPGLGRVATAADAVAWSRRPARLLGAIGRAQMLLRRTAGWSVGVQALSIAAMYCAQRAVGGTLDPLVVAALCGGIFVAAALPLSIGGFGSREAAAAALFAAVGASSEQGVAASVIYGLGQVSQALAVALTTTFDTTETGPARPARLARSERSATGDVLPELLPRLAYGPLALAVLLIGAGALLAGTGLDRTLTVAINHAGAAIPIYASSMAILGLGASALLLAGFVGLRHPHVPAAIIVMIVVGGLVVQIAKNALGMPRPIAVLGPGTLNLIGEALLTRSMPSGHSALFAGVAMLAWIGPWRIASWPVRVALTAVALSGIPMRVVVAAHWPSDVLCGAGIGVAVAAVCVLSRYGVALIARVERFLLRSSGAMVMAALLATVAAGLAVSNTGYPTDGLVRATVVAFGIVAAFGWLVRAARCAPWTLARGGATSAPAAPTAEPAVFATSVAAAADDRGPASAAPPGRIGVSG